MEQIFASLKYINQIFFINNNRQIEIKRNINKKPTEKPFFLCETVIFLFALK